MFEYSREGLPAGNSEFDDAITQGASVIVVQGPNMQHSVPVGFARLVAVLNGAFYYGQMYKNFTSTVTPPNKAPGDPSTAQKEPYIVKQFP